MNLSVLKALLARIGVRDVVKAGSFEVGKPEVFFAQELGGEHGVENALGGESVGLPQESQVVVCTVEDDRLHGGRLEERGEIQAAERVHDVVVLADGNLDKA